MNFFPHIPMLSTVFNSIGCYLLPFGVILLWLLYESKKVKTILLAVLVLLSVAWNQAEYSQDGCDERFCDHIFLFYSANIKKNAERCK